MIPSIPQSRAFRSIYASYIVVFFVYLAAPLIVVSAFAFNDSLFPSLPWNGFSLDWFINESAPRKGLFYDSAILESIGVSVFIAAFVTILSVFVGTCNAFLFERENFPFKNILYILTLLPLVIPGIIAFLMSFENFNTTLMLVGSDAPLTITMFDRLREGSTPVLNAVSLFLMVVSAILALASIMIQREKP